MRSGARKETLVVTVDFFAVFFESWFETTISFPTFLFIYSDLSSFPNSLRERY